MGDYLLNRVNTLEKALLYLVDSKQINLPEDIIDKIKSLDHKQEIISQENFIFDLLIICIGI